MSYIVVSKLLSVRTRPVFIGWLDQWLYSDDPVSMDNVPLLRADVEDVLFSLDKKNMNIPGLNTMTVTTTPVAEYQNISIGEECVKPVFRLDDDFFMKMQIAPMDANFIFVPDNIPPMFTKPGLFIARFDIITTDGDSHTQSVEFTVM